MGSPLNEIILHQFEAAMSTLHQCIQNCPENEWNKEHPDSPFSQVLFHTLIFTDVYLGRSEEAIKIQEFHLQNKEIFRDYEELEDRKPVNLYSKEEIERYFKFLIKKGFEEINKETEKTFYGESGFSFRKFPRLELYVYLIRHIQHHAAQLGLRVQLSTGKELKWVGSGKEDI